MTNDITNILKTLITYSLNFWQFIWIHKALFFDNYTIVMCIQDFCTIQLCKVKFSIGPFKGPDSLNIHILWMPFNVWNAHECLWMFYEMFWYIGDCQWMLENVQQWFTCHFWQVIALHTIISWFWLSSFLSFLSEIFWTFDIKVDRLFKSLLESFWVVIYSYTTFKNGHSTTHSFASNAWCT